MGSQPHFTADSVFALRENILSPLNWMVPPSLNLLVWLESILLWDVDTGALHANCRPGDWTNLTEPLPAHTDPDQLRATPIELLRGLEKLEEADMVHQPFTWRPLPQT